MITRNPKEAVGYALESGTRTAPLVQDDMPTGQKAGAGIGADAYAEYFPIYSELNRMHRQEPAKYAVMMALSPVDSRLRMAVIGEAYEALQDRIEMFLAEHGQRLAAKRAVRLFAMANTAIDLTMRGRLEYAGAEEIARHAFDWYGYRISVSHWAKTYRGDWALVERCLRELEHDCFESISKIIIEVNERLKEAA
ncbi:hypothetical protein R84981_002786 [Carnimonas sp. R-84981]|uniref:hypothetical protein n=1 Tax=Carnimonas bestiolae TaxID=3402172 RepID=UPI003EDC82C3